jgi:hypothetical protein
MSAPERTVVTSAAMIAAAAVLAGCGGEEQVGAEELAQKGDAICRSLDQRFAEIQTEPPANASEGASQAGELLGAADDAQDDLRDLEPPDEIRDDYDRYLEERDEVSDLIERGKKAAEDQDGDAYGKAQSEVAAGAPEREKLARALGFGVCSQRRAGSAAP